MRLKVLATGTVALALLIGASYLPTAAGWPVLVVVLLLLAAFAVGWPRLLKVPAPNPVILVIFLASAATRVACLLRRAAAGAAVVGAGRGNRHDRDVPDPALSRGTDATSRLESAASGMAGLGHCVPGCRLGRGLGTNPRLAGPGPDRRFDDPCARQSPGSCAARPHCLPAGFVLAVLVGGAASIVDSAVHVVPGLVLGAACGLVVVGSRAMLVSARAARATRRRCWPRPWHRSWCAAPWFGSRNCCSSNPMCGLPSKRQSVIPREIGAWAMSSGHHESVARAWVVIDANRAAEKARMVA